MCGDVKELGEFYNYPYTTNQGKRSLRYESRCKPCSIARRKKQYEDFGDRDRATHRRWMEENKAHVRAYAADRQQNDPNFRALKAKSQRLRKARMRSGQPNDPAIRAIYAEAMRIEKLVADCPVFALPELGYKMHVDHIIPLSKGGPHVASNLQIIPIGINMRKGTKCPQ